MHAHRALGLGHSPQAPPSQQPEKGYPHAKKDPQLPQEPLIPPQTPKPTTNCNHRPRPKSKPQAKCHQSPQADKPRKAGAPAPSLRPGAQPIVPHSPERTEHETTLHAACKTNSNTTRGLTQHERNANQVITPIIQQPTI